MRCGLGVIFNRVQCTFLIGSEPFIPFADFSKLY